MAPNQDVVSSSVRAAIFLLNCSIAMSLKSLIMKQDCYPYLSTTLSLVNHLETTSAVQKTLFPRGSSTMMCLNIDLEVGMISQRL